MPTTLRQVLQAFENAREPRTLDQLARELGISPGMLEGMIAYWVRKGKIRETGAAGGCHSCRYGDHCPFVLTMPRTYELVTGDELPPPPACSCCS